MTWTPASDLLTRQLGDPNRGCRDCGSTTKFITPTGHTAYWPSTECCPAAIKRQIAWRQEEISTLQREIAHREQLVADTVAEIEDAGHRDKPRAEARAQRAKRSFDKLMEDKYDPKLRELSTEIRRLKLKLVQTGAAA